jgi:hypothetical protein
LHVLVESVPEDYVFEEADAAGEGGRADVSGAGRPARAGPARLDRAGTAAPISADVIPVVAGQDELPPVSADLAAGIGEGAAGWLRKIEPGGAGGAEGGGEAADAVGAAGLAERAIEVGANLALLAVSTVRGGGGSR